MKKSIGKEMPLYPAPVSVIASYDKSDRADVMTASWVGICCSEPPCIQVSIRKSRHTHDSILIHQAFTINIPSSKYIAETDFFGISSGSRCDKFTESGLHAQKAPNVEAPLVEEFPISIECELLDTLNLGSHVMFIGRVVNTLVSEECLDEKNKIIPEKISPFCIAPGNGDYFALGEKIGKAYSDGNKFMKRKI